LEEQENLKNIQEVVEEFEKEYEKNKEEVRRQDEKKDKKTFSQELPKRYMAKLLYGEKRYKEEY